MFVGGLVDFVCVVGDDDDFVFEFGYCFMLGSVFVRFLLVMRIWFVM